MEFNTVRSAIYSALMAHPNGFTLAPIDLVPIESAETGNKPTGYLVAGIIPGVVVIDAGTTMIPDAALADFIKNYITLSAVLTDDVYIGGWLEDGDLYIDAVIVVPTIERADQLASAWSQQAFGQVEEGEYIRTIPAGGEEPEPVLSDAEIEEIIDDISNRRGDYMARTETLAAHYRGIRDRLTD